jgi:hypothetical protein
MESRVPGRVVTAVGPMFERADLEYIEGALLLNMGPGPCPNDDFAGAVALLD